MGPDGKITYSYIQDDRGVFTSDGGYALTAKVDGTVASVVAAKRNAQAKTHYQLDVSPATDVPHAHLRDSTGIFTDLGALAPPQMTPVDAEEYAYIPKHTRTHTPTSTCTINNGIPHTL